MREIWEELKESYREGAYVTRIIYILVVLFFLARLSHVLPHLGVQTTLEMWLALPSDIYKLLFHFWTPLSYMFLHVELSHFFFNLIGLYWFGRFFLNFFSQRQFLSVYLLGGFMGALFFILGFNYIPIFYKQASISYLMGASASIMALLWAITVYSPSTKTYLLFFGEVKIVYIAIVYALLDLSSLAALENNTGGHLAHIGGALLGAWFGYQIKKGNDISEWFSKILDGTFLALKKRPKIRPVSNTRTGRPLNDMDWNARNVAEKAEVDRILDKVRSSGYESLTQVEKQRLFDASKRF